MEIGKLTRFRITLPLDTKIRFEILARHYGFRSMRHLLTEIIKGYIEQDKNLVKFVDSIIEKNAVYSKERIARLKATRKMGEDMLKDFGLAEDERDDVYKTISFTDWESLDEKTEDFAELLRMYEERKR